MSIPQNPKELTGYIVKTYHDKHRHDLPLILAECRKLEGQAAYPIALTAQLDELFFILESHLAKEENILFPMIAQDNTGMMLQGPISVMMAEHEKLDEILREIQKTTCDFQSDDEAIRNLYQQLSQFKEELMEHAQMEDNILFPKVL